jgi:pyridoxine 4-dehydrogenase
VLVSKVGAARDDQGNWLGAQTPEQLRSGVEANLSSLELDQVPVVNLRRHPESTVQFDEQLDAMKDLRDEGLIGGVGLSNVTLDQYLAARSSTDIACVQNVYNLANREEQPLFDACSGDGVPFVPFFPLGSAFFAENPVLQAESTIRVAARLGATAAQVALAWLLAQAPTVLLIPGTSTITHLEENLEAGALVLDDQALADLGNVTNQ